MDYEKVKSLSRKIDENLFKMEQDFRYPSEMLIEVNDPDNITVSAQIIEETIKNVEKHGKKLEEDFKKEEDDLKYLEAAKAAKEQERSDLKKMKERLFPEMKERLFPEMKELLKDLPKEWSGRRVQEKKKMN